MCILCAISRWSRRIVTMLPWLIIPFIIIWALSQFLPPGFRLEVTSPRLACLLVLLGSLVWYEFLLPRLSSWRARRKALLRERKRIEAQEAAKWRKEATRRCRNCLTAYKIQSPGGGKFMCTYCGHVSKRPVLEVPGAFSHPAGPGIAGNSFSGAYSGGHQLKGAGMPYHRGPWRTGRSEVGSWSWSTEKGDCTWFGNKWPTGAGCLYAVEGGARGPRSSIGENIHGGERYKAGQPSPGSFPFILKILSFLKGTWRKLLGLGSPRRDGSAEGPKSCQRGEDLDGFHGSRVEKARRKAKEKKQARLEKELLEAEERKQREEVALMVEERRKQREENKEIEETEREAAAEREREIRKNRETERRANDKARERVTESVKVGSTELEPKDATIKNKPSLDLNVAKASLKQNTMKSSEINKSAKGPKGFVHDRGLRFRGAKDNSTRLGYSSHIESAKRVPLSTSKALYARGLERAEGSQAKGKSGSATSVPGNSNSSPQSDGVKQVSDNAWKKVPWTNAWVNRNEALIAEGSGMHTGLATGSDQRLATGSDQRLDLNKEGGVKFLGDGELVVKPSMPPPGGMAIQPPIAPPPSHADSLHQLFSTPSIFSPMDFQNQHRQKLHTEIKTSLLPGSTFFDTPACTNFEASEPLAPLSPSTSLQNSIPIQTSLLSPLQAALSVPHDRIGLTCTDTPQLLIPQGPVPDSPLKSSPIETGIASCPVSPCSMSVPDPTIINTSILSPILKPTKMDGSDLCLDKDDSLPWDLSSISLEDPAESVDGTRWQLQEMKVAVSSTWMPNETLLAQEPLQLPLLSTIQSTFDLKTWAPQGKSVLQEHGSLNLNADEISTAAQVSNRKNIWSDFSTFNTTLRVWDDSDINQKTPPEFVDCITQEIMEDPVITADGHSYERTAIEKWLKLHNTSPKTGEVLPPPPGSNGIGVDKTLRPNHILRGQIIDYKERLARMSKVKGLSSSPTSKDIGGFLKTSGTPSGWSM